LQRSNFTSPRGRGREPGVKPGERVRGGKPAASRARAAVAGGRLHRGKVDGDTPPVRACAADRPARYPRHERPITRSLLATFIEYAARDCVTPIEWSRFMVNHYGDEAMEAARVGCVRILQSAPRGGLASADLDRLYAIADELRAADKK
jgi:hypothetical protein